MVKSEKEYLDKYGAIPEDDDERLSFLLDSIKMSKKRRQLLEEYAKRIDSIEWKEVSYIFYIIPKATPRPRKGKGNIFYVKGANDNKEFFKRYVKDLKNFPYIYTPCTIQIDCYFDIPSGMSTLEKVLAEKGLIRPTSKPDWDNVAKTYCDMIQQTMLHDDSLIVDGRCRKFYSIKPRVELKISYMEEFDSSYNENKYKKQKKGV